MDQKSRVFSVSSNEFGRGWGSTESTERNEAAIEIKSHAHSSVGLGREGDQQSWSQCQRVVFPEASEIESHANDEAASLLNHFVKL